MGCVEDDGRRFHLLDCATLEVRNSSYAPQRLCGAHRERLRNFGDAQKKVGLANAAMQEERYEDAQVFYEGVLAILEENERTKEALKLALTAEESFVL